MKATKATFAPLVTMIKATCAVVFCVVSSTCLAGELIADATIVEVATSNNGGAEFTIRTTGYGVCAGSGVWITFPEAKATSPTAHKHAIATALLAFSTAKKVRIHNFQDASCAGANFISIMN
jgi:hypothetical protein